MFIGHYAVGFTARGTLRERPNRPSLGTWFMAVQWLDLVWPILVVSGIEHVRVSSSSNPFLNLEFTDYPWSHSLLGAIAWGGLFGAAYRLRTGNTSSALWLAAGVVSHWALDFVTHMPDLPLYPGSQVRLGLGLWGSPAGTILIEGAMFVVALVWYGRRTRAIDGVGRWALWALAAFLVVVYAASLAGPPPPSETAVGASALLLWLLVPWAYWIDRHRVPNS
jgi:membrane-bound metal-dependent hydrolase YbcI (DUF457 family)